MFYEEPCKQFMLMFFLSFSMGRILIFAVDKLEAILLEYISRIKVLISNVFLERSNSANIGRLRVSRMSCVLSFRLHLTSNKVFGWISLNKKNLNLGN